MPPTGGQPQALPNSDLLGESPSDFKPTSTVVPPLPAAGPVPAAASAPALSLPNECNTSAPCCESIGPQIGIGGCCDGGGWYGRILALELTRDKPNTVYTSAESGNQTIQGSYDSVNSTWGGEVDLGREFGCGQFAVEGVFWTPGLMQSSGGPGIPGPYLSPLVMSTVNILGTGDTGNQWTDNNSPSHMIWRTDEIYDFELNFWKNHFVGDSCSTFNIDGMVGFRYFTFRDRMLFGAERNLSDPSIYAGSWLYINDDVKNSLAGFQFGFNLDWRFADKWKFFFTPKFGFYNNNINENYDLYVIGTTGTHYQGSSQNYTNPNYPVNASCNQFSCMTQIDIGLDWQFSSHVSAQIGYRFVGATNIGLADNQIPIYATDTQAISQINRNGDLTLNGAFAGLSFTF